MNILINYAHNSYYGARKRNSSTGMRFGFDKVIEYGRKDVDALANQCPHIMNQPKGAGFWLWKPYIIYQTLLTMSSEDVLFYCDSGCDFIAPINPLIEACKNDANGLILFEGGHQNKKYTKRDCFTLMGCDTPEFTDILQLTASFQICRKTDFALAFYEEHIKYSSVEQIVTDIPNTTGEDYPEYIAHRHDQSILTNLAVLHKVTLLQDPSQWGNHVGGANVIHHHRERY